MRKKFRSFNECRKFVRTLGLKNEKEWREYCKSDRKPPDIPLSVYTVYKNEWVNWPDFLGSYLNNPRSIPKKSRWSYEKAKAFLKKLGVKGKDEFFLLYKAGKIPKEIRQSGARAYKKEWVSWGDFLGTGTVATFNREYRSFEEARKYVHSLKLKSTNEWFEYIKSHMTEDIPNDPRGAYKNEWVSMGDWLGTGIIANINKKFWSLEKSSTFVQKLGITNVGEFKKAIKAKKIPDDIPSNPNLWYNDKGWVTWGDWFGTGFIAHQNRKYQQFTKARTFVRKLGLKNLEEWREYCISDRKLPDIPSDPAQVYKNEWISSGDWLGTQFVATHKREYLSPIEAKIEARKIAKKLGIKTSQQWVQAHRAGQIPKHLPAYLDNVYNPNYRKRRK